MLTSRWKNLTLGEVTSEETERLGTPSGSYPVYGVDRSVGLTASPKYVSSDLSRYKRLSPGMFAYNPMRLNIGSIGYCSRRHAPGLVSPDYVVFRCDESRLVPDFLNYYTRSVKWRDWAEGSGVGSVRVRIYYRELARMALTLPSLDEQRAIAQVLGTLDEKIELNQLMNQTLEAIARALFKSWFVEFDPVRAKAEGRHPGLPKQLADLFPESFEDSDLGEIPKGWAVRTLSDLCTTQYGYTASAVEEPIGPKLLRVTDINKRNWIEWGDVPHCAIEPDTQPSYALQMGDLVVARMADPGKSAIVEEEIDAVFASYLVRLKTPSLAHSYYVYGFLNSTLYREYAEGAKSGSVQSNMNASVIVGARLCVPPNEVMEQFLKEVLPLRRRLVANVRESGTLATLRDKLLSSLISGDLRVKDAEQFVSKAS